VRNCGLKDVKISVMPFLYRSQGELISSDLDSVNWKTQSILLKSTMKRSNRTVFFGEKAPII